MEAHQNLISRPLSTPFHLLLTFQQQLAPAGVFQFALFPQQWLLLQKNASVFPYRRSRAHFRKSHTLFQMSQQSMLLQKPLSLSDAAAEHASSEAAFSFRCRSRVCFHRSCILFQMPQQSLLPQKPHSLSDAAAESASTEAAFSFRCRSRVCFHRSCILFQMPQQSLLPQNPFLYFPYCHSSSRSLKEPLSLSFSSEGFHRSQLLFPDTTTTKHTPMTSSTPVTLSLAFLGGHKRSYLDAVLF